MAFLTYGGKRIIPAPLITINKNYIKDTDGTKIGVLYDINLKGTLLPFRGSPSGNYASFENAFWTQDDYPPDEPFAGDSADANHLFKKQEAIRYLFRQEGQLLEILPTCSGTSIMFNPRVKSITFDEGTWADRLTYSIQLEADWIFINGLPEDKEDSLDFELIRSAQEEWKFDDKQGNNGTVYQVSHTVSAQGVAGYNEAGVPFAASGEVAGGESWKHAKAFCDSKVIGTVNTDVMFAFLGVTNWIGGSYSKSFDLSTTDGTYSITETWVLCPNNTFIQKSFSIDHNTDGSSNASYDGTIFGLDNGEKTGGPNAIIYAKAAIPTDSQARSDTQTALSNLLGDLDLATSPLQKRIIINTNEGSVGFSFNWVVTSEEDSTFKRVFEATLTFNDADGTYTLSLSCNIQGYGDTIDDKIANAKAAIPSNDEARQFALDIIGDQLPPDIVIGTLLRSKSISINETQGSVNASFSWQNTDSDFSDYQIDIAIKFPNSIVAIIPIPGRTQGPIIQNMETQTTQTVTITLSSSNNISKPDNNTIISTMNQAGGVQSSWILDSDNETYSPITKKYTRVRSFTVD